MHMYIRTVSECLLAKFLLLELGQWGWAYGLMQHHLRVAGVVLKFHEYNRTVCSLVKSK